MIDPKELKQAIRCCTRTDSMDDNCISLGCPLFTVDLADDCLNTLLKSALEYIETLEGELKARGDA